MLHCMKKESSFYEIYMEFLDLKSVLKLKSSYGNRLNAS